MFKEVEHCIKTAKILLRMSKQARANNNYRLAASHLAAAGSMRRHAAAMLALH